MVESMTVFAPAKVNLFLAVVGRRGDGFHDLVSVVVPLDFGDALRVELGGGDARVELSCDDPAVPTGEGNLILRALRAFNASQGERGARFFLEKRIPMGAGLGGGSSNAVAALRALNGLAGGPMGDAVLGGMAAELGSDCPLFFAGAAVVMRGRGERLERLSEGAHRRLVGRRLLLLKPSFGIPTAWAYGAMKARPDIYVSAAEAESRLVAWLEGDARLEELPFNNMEVAAFEKYPALPVLAARLQTRHGVTMRMSGSGSACYVVLPEEADPKLEMNLNETVSEAWGEDCFLRVVKLAG